MAQTPINADPVVGGELIDVLWGNNVVNDLKRLASRKVELDGSLPMTGRLTLPNTAPTDDNHATRKGYVDTHFMHLDGSQNMTADLDMGGHHVVNLAPAPSGANSAIPQAWANDRYLAKAGGTMTGALQVGGKPGPVSDGVGVLLSTDGWIASGAGDALKDTANIFLSRQGGGGAQAAGQGFIVFRREASSPEIIGSIAIESGSSIVYNKTSDPRLKENLGPITDAAQRVQQLGNLAFRGRWIADQGTGKVFDMLSSTDIDVVADYAVMGAADAVDSEGQIVPQMVDFGNLVPLLMAALANALDRIVTLEAKP